MRDPGEITTAAHFPTRRAQSEQRLRLVQRAPGPEGPDRRDRAGAQLGLIVVFLTSLALWGVIATAVIHLLR